MAFRIVLILVCLSIVHAKTTVARADDAFEAVTLLKSDSITQALVRKDYSEAVSLVNEWLAVYEKLPQEKKAQYKQQKINGYYIATCAYAAAGEVTRAIEEFKVLVGIGYANYKQASTDKRLKPLRGNGDFEQLLKIVEQRGDYLGMLRNASIYKRQKAGADIQFRYPRDSKDFQLLRDLYPLDSAAGSGEEHSRIIRLMQWVHAVVPYEGKKENSMTCNTVEQLLAAAHGSTFNCRDLASILKDVYLAMGFDSRYVYCMPKDTSDADCHVVTIVFSRSQNKWVFMDPANSAYLMDEKGRLLGLEEVRERLITSKPMTLNEEANQHDSARINIDDYLYRYLVKNLYWFESPVSSEFNYESKTDGKKINYIRLYPSGYGALNDVIYPYGTAYITRDARQFWKEPRG
jgi:hypothetical protein